MKNQVEYPYNFNLNKIKEMIDFYVHENKHQIALDELFRVKESYIINKDTINREDTAFQHLQRYDLEAIFLYSDESPKDSINDYFLDKINRMEIEVQGSMELKPKKSLIKRSEVNIIPISLEAICHEGAKNKLLSILTDFKVIDDVGKRWIDERAGNKTIAAVLMKIFYTRGYFQGKLTNKEYSELLKTEFGLSVSKETISKAHNDVSFLPKKMQEIPLFTPQKHTK